MKTILTLMPLLLVLAWPPACEGAKLYANYSDSEDDFVSIDVVKLEFVADTVTGAYTIRVLSTADNPFSGSFRININLFNPDVGTTWHDPAIFSDILNDIILETPQTEVVLSGVNLRLTSWSEGDRVAIGSSGLGNPTSPYYPSAFGSGINGLGPDYTSFDIIGTEELGKTGSAIGSSSQIAVLSSIPPQETDFFQWPHDPATPPASTPASISANGAGKYSGFLTHSEAWSSTLGYFKSLKINKAGKFSGKMYFGGISYALKGMLDEEGHYAGQVTARNRAPAAVNLQLVQTAAGSYKIEGSVTVGEQAARFSTAKAGDTTAQAGTYTLLILGEEGEASAPQGNGHATMTVTTRGAARIKGMLGDGTKWTAKCSVTPDGEMPLYAALYRKAGSLGGLVRFRDVDGVSDCDAEVHWRKPDRTGTQPYPGGFDLQRNLIGSRYTFAGERLLTGLADAAPNTEIYAGESGSSEEGIWALEWTEANKLVYTGTEKIKMSVKPRSGLIKGKIPDGGTRWKTAGVVYQKQNLAAGLMYVKGAEPRSLIIAPK